MSVSSRGLGGTFSHAWHTFTSTKATSNTNPSRLLSADSENRWVWWKEAAGAFSDRPVGGWGAGSFGVVHLLYRRDTLTVQQPHSVPLQFLAETGIVGALLALGGFALLLASAAGLPRRLPKGPERLLASALLGGAVAYAVHSLYDWDWDIPAVTLPAFLFLGVLVGARRRATSPAPMRALERYRPHTRARGADLVAVRVRAVGRAPEPCRQQGRARRSSRRRARRRRRFEAPSRARRSPATSIRSPMRALRVEATIALHRGRLARSRAYLMQAVGRDPTDVQAWAQLGQVDALMGDVRRCRTRRATAGRT